MAINTILSDASIGAGPTAPYASEEAFGAGPARAMQGLAQGVSQLGAGLAEGKRRRDAIRDTQWVTESDSTYTTDMVQFIQDNRDAEDLDTKVLERSKNYVQEALKLAPSSQAREALRARLLNAQDSFFRTASTKAIANTSVHGPVAPYERLNCSGAP